MTAPAPLVLTHSDLSSRELAVELAKSLDDQIAAAPGAPVELVDELYTLAAQGAELAAAHRLKGPGSISLSPGAVVVKTADTAIGQGTDPGKIAAKKEARAAAARAAARKKVVATVKGAAGAVVAAVRSAAAVVVLTGPRTSAPSKAPKPPTPPPGTPAPKPGNLPAAAADRSASASTSGAKKSATTPTVPPPAKR